MTKEWKLNEAAFAALFDVVQNQKVKTIEEDIVYTVYFPSNDARYLLVQEDVFREVSIKEIELTLYEFERLPGRSKKWINQELDLYFAGSTRKEFNLHRLIEQQADQNIKEIKAWLKEHPNTTGRIRKVTIETKAGNIYEFAKKKVSPNTLLNSAIAEMNDQKGTKNILDLQNEHRPETLLEMFRYLPAIEVRECCGFQELTVRVGKECRKILGKDYIQKLEEIKKTDDLHKEADKIQNNLKELRKKETEQMRDNQ